MAKKAKSEQPVRAAAGMTFTVRRGGRYVCDALGNPLPGAEAAAAADPTPEKNFKEGDPECLPEKQ